MRMFRLIFVVMLFILFYGFKSKEKDRKVNLKYWNYVFMLGYILIEMEWLIWCFFIYDYLCYCYVVDVYFKLSVEINSIFS